MLWLSCQCFSILCDAFLLKGIISSHTAIKCYKVNRKFCCIDFVVSGSYRYLDIPSINFQGCKLFFGISNSLSKGKSDKFKN